MPRTQGALNRNRAVVIGTTAEGGLLVQRPANYKVKLANGTVVIKTYMREYVKKGRNRAVVTRDSIKKKLKDLTLEQLESVQELINTFQTEEEAEVEPSDEAGVEPTEVEPSDEKTG